MNLGQLQTAKLCECGCGGSAPIAKMTSAAKGVRKGEPQRFIYNHQRRKRLVYLDGEPAQVCTRCRTVRPLVQFHKHSSSTLGVSMWCKPCMAAHRRKTHLGRYGMALDDYERMLAAQGGACGICGTGEPRGMGAVFHVDHDHDTGTIRGLLCSNCNSALGLLGDDPGRLEAAARYLREHA